jgi:hypothetical protein
MKDYLKFLAIMVGILALFIGGSEYGRNIGYQEGFFTGSNYGIFYENVVGQRPNIYWQQKHMNDSMYDYSNAVWDEMIRVKSGLPYIENCTGIAGGDDSKGIEIPQPHTKWGE